MKTSNHAIAIPHSIISLLTFCIAGLGWNAAVSQQTIVLPHNGNYTQQTALQSNDRYHRQLYLLTPAELAASAITNGMAIDAIGFTTGAAPDTSAQGILKVFLQNTTDIESRIDTSWTSVPVMTNTYTIDPLIQGDYEWQVQAVCSGNSPFSASAFFSNQDLSGCNQPEDLLTSNITTTTATFSWYAVESPSFTHYFIQYNQIGESTWTTVTTTSSSYNATGLEANKLYQWNVQAVCSNGSSANSGGFFQTLSADVCNEPSTLAVNSVTNTSANVSWTAAAGATRYDIQYRRKNTDFWFTTISFSNSVVIGGLTEGTTYEWQVRTVCAAGVGAYVGGTDFSTTGTITCFSPGGLKETNLSDTTVTLQWTASVNASSYVLRYRLKNAISWNNATNGMTLVHNDTTIIPETTGRYMIPFEGTGISPFTYTGGGVYVAWEYTNDSFALASTLTGLATTDGTSYTDVIGTDSSEIILCLKAIGEASHHTTLTSDNLRPETWFGSPGVRDSVSVVVVYSTGYQSIPNGNPVINSAMIRNHSSIDHQYPVTLTVKNTSGAVRFTETIMQDVTAGSDMLVEFSSWDPSIIETDSVIVSIPPQDLENVVSNNRSWYVQKVNSGLLAYSDDSNPVTETGFDADSGLVLVRHAVNGCTRITGTQVFLSNSAAGHDLYGVILDENHAVIASSPVFTPSENQIGAWHSFFFTNPPVITDGEYYIGLALMPVTGNCNAVGIQYESDIPRDSAFYKAELNGDNLAHHPSPGRPMIRSLVTQALPLPSIEGDLSLCAGDENTLSVASQELRYATAVAGYSSQYSEVQYSVQQVLGPPDVYPSYGGHPSAWASATFDGQREYLSLTYEDPAPINRIIIYETFNPGAVDSVYIRNPNTGNLVLMYSDSAASSGSASNALTIEFPLTAFNVSEVRIAINSPSVGGFNSIDAVAIGQYDLSPSYTSVEWSPGGETTFSIEVNTAGTYSVTVNQGASCSASTSVEVITPSGVSPTISAGGPTSFCPGGSVTLTSDQPTGNTWSTAATTQSIVVTTSGTYFVMHDDGTGCGSTHSNSINVTVYPQPSPDITGDSQICPGGSTTLNAGSFDSYAWSTGATTQTINVSTIGLYQVTVTDANGCTGVASVVVSLSPGLSPVITGDNTFCLNDFTTLDAGSYANYDWSTGATTQTIIVTTAGVYSVTVEDANGCTGSGNFTAIGLVPPSPIITGIGGFCPGGETTLNAGDSYPGYAWSNAETSQTVLLNSAGLYTVTVTDVNGCTGTDDQSVVVFTPPSPFISGTLSFCAGSSTELNAGPGYQSYMWSTGETSQSINVDTTDTYSVTVIDNNGCSGTASATTTHEGAIPVSPDPINGPTSGVCGATNIAYTIPPVPNAAFYVWTVPDNVTIVSGQGTTTLIVDFELDFTSGDIVVAASNACGQSPSIDPTFLTVSGTAEVPGPISGPTSNVCPGDQAVFSIANIPSASGYEWTVPPTAQIVSGQNTTLITVSFQNGFNGGNICVSSTNTCGNSAPSCLTIVNGDQDNDGVPDCQDNCPYNPNTNQKDKDKDGIGDACDPCNNNQQSETCNDGDPCTVNDHLDPYCNCVGTYMDSDNDGVCNAFDICQGFDDNVDSDSDGVPDGCDECPGFDDNNDENNNGIPDDCDFCVTLLVDAGDCQTVYYGYAPAQCATLSATALTGTAPFTYAWSNGSSSQNPNVCPTTTTIYTVTITDANGCNGTAQVTVQVIDVRCGGGNKNVEICHYNSANNTYTTQCVKTNQVPGHLSHGDALGECGITPCASFAMYSRITSQHDADEDHIHSLTTESINQESVSTPLTVYPNPANDQLTIAGTGYANVKLHYVLMDLQGKVLVSGKYIPEASEYQILVSLEKMQEGMFILCLHQSDITHQEKVMIIK